MNFTWLLTLLFASLLWAPLSANASNSWQMAIDSSRLSHYMDYPGSSLKSVIKLSVAYQLGNDESVWNKYETFYYNNSLPIGCNRHASLSIEPGAGGIIKVTSSSQKEMQTDECDAVVNATGRVFLDLYSKHCAVYDIIVPDASFDAVIAGFVRSGFHTRDQGDGAAVVLDVVSDPPGRFLQVAY